MLLEQMNLDITIKMSTLILFFGWKKNQRKLHCLLPHFLLPQIGQVMFMEYISLLIVVY